MIKALLAIAITTASGTGLLDVREPNRANQVDQYRIVNATSNQILVDYYPEDSTVTIPANQETYISHETSGTINVYTNTKFDGYCFFASDSEDLVTITWNAISGNYSWFVTIPDYEPATGIGFYNRTALPTNSDFFIDTEKLGIYSPNSTFAMNSAGVSLLPDNATAKIYKSTATWQSVSNLRLWRYKTKNNIVAVCVWTTIANYPAIIAQNFYVPSINGYANYAQFCEQAEKSNSISPQLMYWKSSSADESTYTNKIRFNSGYYPFAPNDVGYVEPYYLTSNDTGYIAINNDGTTADSTTFEVLTKTMEMVGKAMSTAVGFLGYMVFPGITIGFLVLLPLIISLLIVILKMVKKG